MDPLQRIDSLYIKCHRKALLAKWLYYGLATSQLLIATSIPLVAIISPSTSGPVVNGLLGASILIVQGIQQIVRPNNRWIQNRVAARKLASEKYLFLARGGPYRDMTEAQAVVALAERTENFACRQNDQWEQMMESLFQSEKVERSGPRRDKKTALLTRK